MASSPDTHTFPSNAYLAALPTQSGIYRMLNAQGEIIYIGKAKNLKNRVSQYFKNKNHPIKTQKMVEQIADISVTTTFTDAEAFLLEATLIKRHRPKYNILLRDDKSYPYIYLSDHPWPGLFFHRGAQKKTGSYFGPYANSGAVYQTLHILQKTLPLRQCEDSVFANRSRPCLQYQIGRCLGPCVGLVQANEYAKITQDVKHFLQGKSFAIIEDLAQKMHKAAENLEFEQAAKLRDTIAQLRSVQSQPTLNQVGDEDTDVFAIIQTPHRTLVQVLSLRQKQLWQNQSYYPRGTKDAETEEILVAFVSQYYAQRAIPPRLVMPQALEGKEELGQWLSLHAGRQIKIIDHPQKNDQAWLKMALENAQVNLEQTQLKNQERQEALLNIQNWFELPEFPQRMECFDISHTQGVQTQASCVVFVNGEPSNKDYRRFNLKDITPGDDYAAMKQVLTRRYAKLPSENWPQLVLIDGGKGQLSQAIEVLKNLKIQLPLVSIAKGEGRKAGLETFFTPTNSLGFAPEKSEKGFLILQHLRDEAHRFAISGHRQARSKASLGSSLEKIPGVGPQTRKKLLAHFGGIQAIRQAGLEELKKVQGISEAMAQSILDHL